MNVSNILRVADAIEQASVPGLGFNMGVIHSEHVRGNYRDMSGASCGTVACIAGWTLAVAAIRRTGLPGDDMKAAADYLGLAFSFYDGGAAVRLFLPANCASGIHTPAMAVRVLRILAITGKVDWDAAMKDDEPVLPGLPAAAQVEA